MIVYKGKYSDLWKLTRLPGSGVHYINTLDELEEAIFNQGSIRASIGNGSIPYDKKDLAFMKLDGLKDLIKKGIVYVENDSWIC